MVNHRLPPSLEFTNSPSIPMASTLLEHILKPLHFSYSSCTAGARYDKPLYFILFYCIYLFSIVFLLELTVKSIYNKL